MAMATGSLTDYLALMEAHVPTALIDAAQWQQIHAIGQFFPSAITTFFGFECRLGVADAKADFLLCADATEAGRRVLAANAYGIDVSQDLFYHPVWQNLRQFSTNWESEASILYDKVQNVWLEFDTAAQSNHLFPVPSCFFGPTPLFRSPAVHTEHPHGWVWQKALPLILGRSLPSSVEAALMQCLACLPEQAYVFQVGVMLSRQWDGVRLCVRNISPSDVISYLKQINWQGDSVALQDLLNDIAAVTDRIDLDIDVSDHVLPKIGLECYLYRQPKFDDRWNTFLDLLVLQGKCSLAKRQALLEYSGYIRERTDPTRWPASIRKLTGLLGPNYEWVVFKGLHHIKLVYQESQVQEAKVYLYVSRSLISNLVKA
jgi:hypothetical protein